jgi:outer membrane protein assembly factor BamB
VAASVLVWASAGLAAPSAQAQGTADWSAYLLDTGHSSYNAAATSISTGNVANLQPVWQWFEPQMTGRTFDASPTVVNGVVYIGSETGFFYAISEATRTVLWSRNFGVTASAACGRLGITATAAVVNDQATGLTVYVNAPDGQLYALSAATGATLWHATVDTPSTTVDDFYAWGSPLVANGHVYVGISSQCDDPLVPAGVVEFNQDTGASEGSWQSLPSGQRGASVWSSPAESTLGDGSIFVTTGNAGVTPQPPNAESVIRLSGTGLSLQDSWHVPAAQQTGNNDFGGSPTVFTADLNGTTTPMVGACSKNGIYYAFRQADLHDGPVWQQRIAVAYGTQPNPGGQCDAAAIWDGTNFIEAGGNATTINGVTYQGSVQSLNPATGTPIWQTGLPGEVIGSPTEDGAGVVAAAVFQSNTGNYGVYLLSAASGAIIGFISTGPSPASPVFAQPVFAGNDLLLAGNFAVGLKAYEITTPGPPITAVTPSALGQGGSVTVTLTGSGFSGTPSVFVSGTLVTVSSVVINSPTSLQVKLTAASNAAVGPRNITVIEPGNVADTCSGCLAIDPGPTVSSASPNSVPRGETANITVTGSNFQPGAKIRNLTGVTFSGTTTVSPTQLTSTVTVSPTAALGTDKLWVTNPDGGTGACACLTVTSNHAPALSSVSPGSAGQQGSDTLTLTGTDFTTNSQLSFAATGITLTSLHYNSPTSLTAKVTVSNTATLGPGNVTVSTPGGSATCAGCLTIDPHPAVSKLTPNTIPNGTTATVIVSGSNFVSGLRVTTTIPAATVGTLANVTQTSFSVTVTVPAGTAPGSYSLKVINPDNGAGAGTIKVT